MSKTTADPRRKMTEKEVTDEIVAALKAAKYVTPTQAINGAMMGTRAGFYLQSTKVAPAYGRGTGGSEGLPDMWIFRQSDARWFGIEIKRPLAHRTKVSQEQQLLAAFGATFVVTSAAEVLAILSA